MGTGTIVPRRPAHRTSGLPGHCRVAGGGLCAGGARLAEDGDL